MGKTLDVDLLREIIGFAAERLMEMKWGFTGAGYGEKNPLWMAQRNGYRDRDWKTRGRPKWYGYDDPALPSRLLWPA